MYNWLMIELKGKPISDEILADLREKIARERAIPGLAVVLVGNDVASGLYVGLKKKRAEEIGCSFSLYEFGESVEESDVIEIIEKLNSDNKINGIVVQLPLPEKFDAEKIINSIDPKKDVDGFSSDSGALGLEPVFPKAIMKLVESAEKNLEGKTAIAIVNSEKFGLAMKEAFAKRNISGEYVLSEKVGSEKERIAKADIVVSALGKPEFLGSEFFKEGVVVIDGGISKVEEKVVGDVDADSLSERNVFLSPVPGGVGPVTIACLLENVYIAYKNQNI